jgi:L-threonylcarbamoyladenylate synthase
VHDDAVREAAAALRRGELVAFPTETVYGLGADASSAAAVRRLFAVKRRPADHPVIVHLGSADALDEWAGEVPDGARALAGACWPGPLTLVLRRAARVPDEVTGGRDTVGLRVPAHATALALLREFGGGVAAPSANRFGRVSPTSAAEVRADLGADVDVVLDGGRCPVGLESTIVDWSTGPARVLRLGGTPRERIEELVGGPVPVTDRGEVAAPGTLPSHYAPDARVIVVEDGALAAVVRELLGDGRRVGVLALKLPQDLPAAAVVLGEPTDAEEYARSLYRWLRRADELGFDTVVAAPPAEVGIGAAVTDRLRRAAGARS